MALVKVISLDGVTKEKEVVDARECVELLGWKYADPNYRVVPKVQPIEVPLPGQRAQDQSIPVAQPVVEEEASPADEEITAEVKTSSKRKKAVPELEQTA